MKIGNMNQSINAYGGVNYVTHQSGKAGYNGYYGAMKREYSDLDEETADNKKKTEDKRTKVEENTTDTDIIVKPDGSRVLIVTTNIGGMTTNMSLKISEPTEAPNEISEPAEAPNEISEPQSCRTKYQGKASSETSQSAMMSNENSEINAKEEENQNVRGWNKGTGIFTAGSEWSNAHTGGI